MKYFLKALKNWSFEGRARRSEFWYFTLFSLILELLADCIPLRYLGTKVSLFLFIPSLAVTTRRFHDVGKSVDWWVYAAFIFFEMYEIFLDTPKGETLTDDNTELFFILSGLELAFFIWLIVVCCKKGDIGANQYGEDPKLEN